MSGVTTNTGTATASTHVPPQHPASGIAAGTSAHQVHDGSAGAQGANVLGDKIKGAFGVVHGAGEGIRGNINSFLDNAGEQIAGRGQGDSKPATKTEGQEPAQVAAKGADEFQAGMDRLRH